MDVLADNLVVAGIAHDVHAAKKGHWRQHSVRAVEQSDLALVVRLLRRNKQYVESSLVCGELFGHFLGGFNHPKVEVLGLHHQVVAIAYLLLNLCNLLARETGHDAVNECGIDAAALVKPLLELLGQLPQFDILVDAVLEHVTIEEYQLAGEDDESLGRITVECLPAAVQQLHELAGI